MKPIPELLVIIPARGGSKGIPKKNIVDVCGKPLIAYSIECALKSKHTTRVVVSTDDEKIAYIAEQYGAEVPFLRPKKISGHRASIGQAVHHLLREFALSGYRADIHCILLPTHLFRQPRLLNIATEKILEGYHEAHTVRHVFANATSWCLIDEKKKIKPLVPKRLQTDWSQYCYRPYGCLSIYSARRNPKGSYLFPISNPLECIDIDTHQDLKMAELIIRNNLYDFDMA